MTSMTRRSLCLLAASSLLPALRARAQDFPAGTVSIIVPYSPGNGLDLLGREFADLLREQFKVPVVVENREGAAGVIGTQYAMRAAPNGQTLLFTANPPFVTSPYALDTPPYDPLSSLLPVARVGSVPLVLVTSGKSSIKTIAQLREHLKNAPDSGTYASAGVGSPGQIFGELFNQAAGLQLREVRYRATGQALVDVMAGTVLVSLVSLAAAAPQIKSGSLQALGVGSRQRIADFKDVPTLAEALGVNEFQAGVWYGFFVPPGTPAARVEFLEAEIAKAARSGRMLAFLERQYMVPELLGPTQFAQTLRNDVDLSRKLVERAKLTAK